MREGCGKARDIKHHRARTARDPRFPNKQGTTTPRNEEDMLGDHCAFLLFDTEIGLYET